MEKGGLPLWLKLFCAVVIAFCFIMAGYIALLIVSFTGVEFYMSLVPVTAFGLMIFAELFLFSKGKRSRRRIAAALFAFLVLLVLIISGYKVFSRFSPAFFE